jgi:hypothetical protein
MPPPADWVEQKVRSYGLNEDIILNFLKTAFAGRFHDEAGFNIQVGVKLNRRTILNISFSYSIGLTNTSSMFQRS